MKEAPRAVWKTKEGVLHKNGVEKSYVDSRRLNWNKASKTDKKKLCHSTVYIVGFLPKEKFQMTITREESSLLSQGSHEKQAPAGCSTAQINTKHSVLCAAPPSH